MFAQSNPKPKFSIGTGGAYRAINSRNRFVNDLNGNEHKLLNQSFDSAERQLRRNNLRQTTLCIRPSAKKPKLEYTAAGAQNTNTQSTEFILLPLPAAKSNYQDDCKTNLNKTFCGAVTRNEYMQKPGETINEFSNLLSTNAPKVKPKLEPSGANVLESAMLQKGRDLIALFGKVDFCLKIHKQYADINALWSVYGKLLKIMPGKNRYEQILCLRNENRGPVLQCVYYDFNGTCEQFTKGDYMRVVGRMNSLNRIKTFVIEKIDEATWNQSFTRFYNITEFVLAQRKNNNGASTNQKQVNTTKKY